MTLREQNIARHRAAYRHAAYGLLNTAREWKSMNRPDQVAKLVDAARWHMHMAVRTI